MSRSIPSQNTICKGMGWHLINIAWHALAVNVQMLGSPNKKMNLSSKVNSFKLPTNCDTWENNVVLS